MTPVLAQHAVLHVGKASSVELHFEVHVLEHGARERREDAVKCPLDVSCRREVT